METIEYFNLDAGDGNAIQIPKSQIIDEYKKAMNNPIIKENVTPESLSAYPTYKCISGFASDWSLRIVQRKTQNRLKMRSFNFRVVLSRIRLFPTLISKRKWLSYELQSHIMIIIKQKNPRAVDYVNQAFKKMIWTAYDLWIFHYSKRRASLNDTDENALYFGTKILAQSELSFKK